MKVLLINGVYNKGSTGKIVNDIEQMLKETGNQPFIAYATGNTSNTRHFIMQSIFYQKISILQDRILGKHGFYNKSATLKLLKWIDKIQPDVIHLHNLHGYYINIKLLFNYLSKYKGKIVWTLHDCWGFTGHCAHFDDTECRKWEDGCYDCPIIKKYPKSWFFDRSRESWIEKRKLILGLNNMIVVTPSKWLSKVAETSFLNKYQIKVINNGVDLSVFKKKEATFFSRLNNGNKFVILGMANKCLNKLNISNFEKFVEILYRKNLIVLVGSSEKELSNKLKGKVEIVPYINNPNDLASIYSSSDVFINLTREDTFPTVNIEALACGTPVITFDVGGSSEIIDEKTGIVVQKDSTEELLEAIYIIKGKGKRSFSDECINRAHSLYNKQNKYKEYLELYNSR